MKKIIPLKRFGQNYLVDKNIVTKIINQFNPVHENKVIEIGPGQGALTAELTQKLKELWAVEIDKRVIEDLTAKYKNLHIINKDFLDYDINELAAKLNTPLRIIGNIPYNITSPILFKLIRARINVKDIMLMVQYEVAKRIIAKKRTKDYGILSVITNYFADVELCFKVPSSVFTPKPKVDSAIIHLDFSKKNEPGLNEELFIQTVKACFGNRRKTLKNSLSNSIFSNYDFSSSGIDLSKRAEELEIPDFIQLTNFIERQQDG